ncbi:MAG TPA: TolC family protein [Candidatus Dormibacteraeota bacterium]|nr:TolC family protein [Candidatus Dormibacteraeota bacterium]
MRVLYALFLVCACALNAAAEDPFAAADALLPQHQHSAASGPTFTRDEIEQIALLRNPEIQVAVRRLAVVEAHRPAAGALDDPALMYRGWGVPLRRPWDYNAAQNMFMVSQTFPGFGKRALRSDIAQSDVAEAKAALDNTRLDVQVRVRKAFYDLLRTQDELRLHDGHVSIARQAVEAARIKYTVGKVPQQDILKAQLELTRLAEHLIRFEQDAEIARARLNTLLGHDPSASINVLGDYAIPQQLAATEALEKLALASRTDLAQARVAVEKSHQQQALASKDYNPDFTVSGGYMLMPSGANYRNNYMLEGSINLPWLNRRKHDAEISEAKAQVSEQDAELAAMRNAAFGQIQEALVQVRSAKRFADLYKGLLQPQATASLRSTVIAYENDRTDFLNLLDSQMTVVDIDLAYFQALADFEMRFADLELAVGAPIDRTEQPNTPEVTK